MGGRGGRMYGVGRVEGVGGAPWEEGVEGCMEWKEWREWEGRHGRKERSHGMKA